MNYPCIDLMVEDTMTGVEDLSKHIFIDWVSSGALLVDRIKKLSSLQVLFFDLLHERNEGWKHLVVDS